MHMTRRTLVFGALAGLFLASAGLTTAGPAKAEKPAPVHGLAMHGSPKYKAGFKNFAYVNPVAPKGGTLRLGTRGTFDTFNGFVIRGTAASSLGLLYDTLAVSSADEPFTLYGLLAESMEMPKDRSWIIFNLRKTARFHDGKPITADDVVFTFNLLIKKGLPQYAYYYSAVIKVEKLAQTRVKFTFKPGENRELPLIASQLVVLPKHYWEKRDFNTPTLKPPLGSGPYKIAKFEAGRRITYERVKDYWAKDLPVNIGRFNFDRIRIDYFRDITVLREALKSGRFDLRRENQAKAWATAYDIPAQKAGKLILLNAKHGRSAGMQAFVLNNRNSKFKDPRVRRAIGYAFDFAYTNKTLFFGQYSRTKSFFENSELAARGLPKGEELKILERFRGRIPDEVFTKVYDLPAYGKSGDLRKGLRKAFSLFKAAGWVVKKRKLVNAKTGEEMRFEILSVSQEFERIYLPFTKNLRRLGIDARVRLVDPAQYEERMKRFDFEVTTLGWGQALSPGNEQRNMWSSAAAGTNGSRNYIGIKNKTIDALIELVISAPDRKALVARTRALDRVLIWSHFVIPQWHLNTDRIAYWNKFGRPGIETIQGENEYNWWVDKTKKAALGSALKND